MGNTFSMLNSAWSVYGYALESTLSSVSIAVITMMVIIQMSYANSSVVPTTYYGDSFSCQQYIYTSSVIWESRYHRNRKKPCQILSSKLFTMLAAYYGRHPTLQHLALYVSNWVSDSMEEKKTWTIVSLTL